MDKHNIQIFGIDSKTGKYVFRYPWRTAFIILFLLEITVFAFENNFEAIIKSVIVLFPVFLVNILIVRYFTNNHCYKIIINKNEKQIKFYRFFNQGVKADRLNDVKILIHRTCDLIINQNTYTVFPAVLHEIVPYLPSNTEIKFSGFFGRIKKRDWKKHNKPFTPGRHIND